MSIFPTFWYVNRLIKVMLTSFLNESNAFENVIIMDKSLLPLTFKKKKSFYFYHLYLFQLISLLSIFNASATSLRFATLWIRDTLGALHRLEEINAFTSTRLIRPTFGSNNAQPTAINLQKLYEVQKEDQLTITSLTRNLACLKRHAAINVSMILETARVVISNDISGYLICRGWGLIYFWLCETLHIDLMRDLRRFNNSIAALSDWLLKAPS